MTGPPADAGLAAPRAGRSAQLRGYAKIRVAGTNGASPWLVKLSIAADHFNE